MKNIVILLSAMLFMVACEKGNEEMKEAKDRKSTRLNSSHSRASRMPSSA